MRKPKKKLVGIDTDCIKTYFKPKISKSKFSLALNFSWGLCHFLATMTKIDEIWQSQKILVEIFLSKSIQTVSKCILNRKSRNRKLFHVNFFLWTLSFFTKTAKILENDRVKKFRSKKIFWSESIRNVSKRISTRKSLNRNFSHVIFFLGLCRFLA